MAKLSHDELKQIIEQEMPGHTLPDRSPASDSDAPPSRAKPDAVTPDIDALRRKYLNRSTPREGAGAADAPAGGPGEASGQEAENTIVVPEPIRGRDAWDRSAGPKAVVVSGATKKIVGRQG